MKVLRSIIGGAVCICLLTLFVSHVLDAFEFYNPFAVIQAREATILICVALVTAIEVYLNTYHGYRLFGWFYPAGVLDPIDIPDGSQLGPLVLQEGAMLGEISPPYQLRYTMNLSLYKNYLVARPALLKEGKCLALIPLEDVLSVESRGMKLGWLVFHELIEVTYRSSPNTIKFYTRNDGSQWVKTIRSLSYE